MKILFFYLRPGPVYLYALLTVFLCLGALGVEAASARAYQAQILMSEPGLSPRVCGKAAVSGQRARLDIDLGQAGYFSAFIQLDNKVMFILAEKLGAFVEIPLGGHERTMFDLVLSFTRAATVYGVPMLSILPDTQKDLGQSSFQGYRVFGRQDRFQVVFVGNTSLIELVYLENQDFQPLPLKISEVSPNSQSAAGVTYTGNSVELTNIVERAVAAEELELPSGVARLNSVFELLLYAVSSQL